jgi:hypothetical protein
VILLMVSTVAVSAQERAIQEENASGVTGQVTAPRKAAPATTTQTHNFWDRENIALFAGVVAGRGLDYFSTLNIRRRGLNEALLTNAIVDNHPAFATIEIAGSAASIGLSYLFHRSGHHRLERVTSIVHIGLAVAGAGRNYGLKSAH